MSLVTPFWDANPVAEMPSDQDRIIQEEVWRKNSLVAWGGLRPGGAVTCHVPVSIERWGGTSGGRAACMPNMGVLCTWTVQFGYDEWTGATLCRRCFDKSGRPKIKWMPKGGWFAYVRAPKSEVLTRAQPTELERRVIAVSKILDLPRKDGEGEEEPKRIVEI